MLKNKFIRICFLIAAIGVSAAQASAEFTYKGLIYESMGTNEAVLKKIPREVTGEVVIPTYIDVISFGQQKRLYVTRIGDEAGSYSHITKITAEGIKTIGERAFVYSGDLQSARLGNELTFIGRAAFGYCEKLTDFNFSDKIRVIDVGAFNHTALPFFKVPEACESLCENAFLHSSIEWVQFNSKVTRVQKGTFRECSKLRSVTWGNSITTIDEDAFAYCGRLEGPQVLPNTLRSIGPRAFMRDSLITSVYLRNVTELPENVFEDCKSLESVYDAEKLSTVNEYAFRRCPIKNFDFPPTLTWIGDYAFQGAFKEYRLVIGKTVKYIGFQAFAGAGISELCFAGTDGLTINAEAFQGSGVRKILFCENQDEAGYRILDIPENAFRFCRKLESVDFGYGKKRIGDYAFQDCASLVDVDFRQAVLDIGHDAFLSCSSLKNVAIPRSCKTLGRFLFTASSVEEIVLGDSSLLTDPSELVLSSCSLDVSGKVKTTIVSWYKVPPRFASGSGTISRYDYNITLYVPKGCAEAYASASGWKHCKAILEMGDDAGLGDVSAETPGVEVTGYYNAHGVKSAVPWPGLNIARRSDGSVAKFLSR